MFTLTEVNLHEHSLFARFLIVAHLNICSKHRRGCHGLPLGNLSLDKQPRTGDLWVQSPVSFPTRPKYNYHPALPSKHL